MVGFRHEDLRERARKLAASAEWLKQHSGIKSAPFTLAFLTDCERVPNPINIAQALPEGAAVVLRDYAHPQREMIARGLRSVCAARSLLLLVGEDAALARAVEADGLHLPARALTEPPPEAADFSLLTASCHQAFELDRAHAAGADLAFLSPAYRTHSHEGAAALHARVFVALAALAKLPVLALGGVDEYNCRGLAGPNVVGLAAIGAFMPRAARMDD